MAIMNVLAELHQEHDLKVKELPLSEDSGPSDDLM
jgi:hypothetical protein